MDTYLDFFSYTSAPLTWNPRSAPSRKFFMLPKKKETHSWDLKTRYKGHGINLNTETLIYVIYVKKKVAGCVKMQYKKLWSLPWSFFLRMLEGLKAWSRLVMLRGRRTIHIQRQRRSPFTFVFSWKQICAIRAAFIRFWQGVP